jgi:hypothetical protein
MRVPTRRVELCHILLCCISGAGMRFDIGPSNLIEGHKREENDGKHSQNEYGSEKYKEAISWAAIAIVPSSSCWKERVKFIVP